MPTIRGRRPHDRPPGHDVLIAQGSDAEVAPDLSGYDGLVVSSLSWSELTKGLHVTTSLPVFKERLARLEALRRAFGDGLPYDDACVRRYDALLRRGVEQGGDARAHVLDRMIAATAVEHGTAVVTRDRSGFRGLEGLLVVDER